MAEAHAAAASLDRLDIVGPQAYADRGYPHAEWARLRRECPVYRYDRGDACTPFWAITRHADVVAVSRRPRILWNAPRLAVFPEGQPPAEPIARHLLNMDPPDHATYRRLVSQHFTPRAVRRLQPEIARITRDRLDALAAIGPDQAVDEAGSDGRETADRARRALFEYFAELARERRERPREDIASVLARARVGGAPVPPFELLSYFFLLVVAGNETTRNAMSGGLLALMEHPEQWQKLRANPGGVEAAVEEILRWTTPVIQFCRTAVEPVTVRGQEIPAGDHLCLFYPSANRDEEVFDEPFAFRVDRQPNPHLAFGIGEHFCLGANLARLELRELFSQLAARFAHFEPVGPAERLRSSFLGGVKHLPVRCRPASA
jgi:cholest-4-en-3-one 26-monooxygenase